MAQEYKNWGRTFKFIPAASLQPASLEEMVTIVKEARAKKQHIRVIGSGHSWAPLIKTADILVSLDSFQGLVSVDKAKMQITVKAGTKLWQMGEILNGLGLAMQNMGDINVQSIAGALATGTHGTGRNFGVIATQVIGLTLVNGKGELVELTRERDGDLFRAAAVSLGLLGITAHITLQCVPAYNLESRKWMLPVDEGLATADQLATDNRNFEFFFFPHSERCQPKSYNITAKQPSRSKIKYALVDYAYENAGLQLVSEISRRVPGASPRVSRFIASGIPNGTEVDTWNNIYAAPRLIKFKEMEYGVPSENGPECVRRILNLIKKENIAVHYPMEYRYVQGDDLLISPAEGGERVFIACQMYRHMPHERFFKASEEIFLQYGGRPHWGKMHNLEYKQLSKLYPKLDTFLAIREQQDPDKVFTNPHTSGMFGL